MIFWGFTMKNMRKKGQIYIYIYIKKLNKWSVFEMENKNNLLI